VVVAEWERVAGLTGGFEEGEEGTAVEWVVEEGAWGCRFSVGTFGAEWERGRDEE